MIKFLSCLSFLNIRDGVKNVLAESLHKGSTGVNIKFKVIILAPPRVIFFHRGAAPMGGGT